MATPAAGTSPHVAASPAVSRASAAPGRAAGPGAQAKPGTVPARAVPTAPAWGLVAVVAIAAWSLVLAWFPGVRSRALLTRDPSAGLESPGTLASRESTGSNNGQGGAASRANAGGGVGADQRANVIAGLEGAEADALCEQPGG
ncbi:MAG: hypothetical protein ACK5HA_15195, partial [Planctomycetaceae bacterium]